MSSSLRGVNRFLLRGELSTLNSKAPLRQGVAGLLMSSALGVRGALVFGSVKRCARNGIMIWSINVCMIILDMNIFMYICMEGTETC